MGATEVGDKGRRLFGMILSFSEGRPCWHSDRVAANRWMALTTLGLAAGTVIALGAVGGVGAPAADAAATGIGSTYFPLTAVRLFDTRTNGGTLGAGGIKTVAVVGVAGIPADATALILNVTVVNGTVGSFLTVYPDGFPLPTASNLNWVAGQAPTPNQVTVPIGADGRIDFFNAHGRVDVIADLEGYFAGGTFPPPTTVTTTQTTTQTTTTTSTSASGVGPSTEPPGAASTIG